MRSDSVENRAAHHDPVERDYPATYEALHSIGPLLMEKIGNGGKGLPGTRRAKWTCCVLNYTSGRSGERPADAQHGD
ncbi:hypothetical protein KCP70_25560 [Salmonella enterica subsp. enterica]|nr:hypothetical protein KCP70_25560 [Salmonella enterica subsp. enterica]